MTRYRDAHAASRPCPWSRSASVLLLIFIHQPAHAERVRHDLADLPLPSDIVDLTADQRLELELFVNGMQTGIIAPVTTRGGRFEVHADHLRQAGLMLGMQDGPITLDSLDGVHVAYDEPRQQLHLTVLPHYLRTQRLAAAQRAWQPAGRDTGALLNYDLYASGGGGAPVQASLWHEARLFGTAGVFSTSGSLRGGGGGRYARFDTSWRWSDETTATTIEAGDLITRTLPWAPAVRLGGVQVSRDFSVRPDIVTYPLPEFAGSAALPSTVDLIVDGERIAGSQVNPGPFSLATMPLINGFGQADLVVTDMHGRSIVTSSPFYISSALLRPGLTDYAVAAGALRRNFGLRAFDYGRSAASLSVRHGVTQGLTLEVRAEAAGKLRAVGVGGVAKLGHFGVLSSSYSHSDADHRRGGELAVGYEYQTRRFSAGLRHVRTGDGYLDLGRLDHRARAGRERLTSAFAGLSLDDKGTVGLGYFDLRQQGAERSRVANASWAIPVLRFSRLLASVSHDFGRQGWYGALSINVPLGSASLGTSLVKSRGRPVGVAAQYTRPVPSEGGFGVHAGTLVERGSDPYLQGHLTCRTAPVQLQAGAYGWGQAAGWVGATGSLVMMDGTLFAANRVSDAFAVVSTGQAGIPVLYENQLIGSTDDRGRLLVPAVSGFYQGRFDIDTLSLPAGVNAPTVSRRVAVAAGGGHIIRMPIEAMHAARANIVDAAGEHLPAGSPVTVNGRRTTYVGWGGLLFMEDAREENLVEIELPDDSTCHATFSLRASATEITDVGVLRCLP